MILITGATGLLGSHLALHLAEKGVAVSAIYRSESAIVKTKALFSMYGKVGLFSKINWILADITDIPSLEVAFENIEYVYHCAAKISFDPHDEEQLRKINIEGTANIVNFCLAKNVKKICFVSSIAALGDLPDRNPQEPETIFSQQIDEETEWNPERPHSDYAISKYGAEMELWRGQQEGMEVVIVNPGVILGPIPRGGNRSHGSFKLIKTIAEGLNYYTHGTTGFVGVNDVVQCMVLLMESNCKGNRYILVSENVSYKNITALIATKLKVPLPKKEAKTWMTEIAWRWDWIASNVFLQKRNFTKAMAKAMHSQDLFSNQKIQAQFDFKFESIEKVIEKIAEKY
jgi:dihydroflavonol-4-reductase